MGTTAFGRFAGLRGWTEFLAFLPNRGYNGTAVRFLPGYEEEMFAAIDEILGQDITRDFVNHDIEVEIQRRSGEQPRPKELDLRPPSRPVLFER